MLTNVPRIRDVEVLVELLVGLGATVEGVGTPTLRIQCATVTDRPPGSGAGRQAARLGAAARAAPRPARVGAAGAAGRRLPGPAHDLHAPAGAGRAWAPCRVDEPGHALDAPDGLTGASFYLDEASVTGTETALLAAAAAHGPHRDPPRRDGTARRRAVPVPARDGRRRSRARGRRRFGSKARQRAPRRGAPARRRLHRGRQLGRRRGDHRRRHRGRPARAPLDMEVVAAPLRKMGLRLQLRRRRVRRRAVDADRGPPDHDRSVARLPERHGQPRHRAGDAGRRADARARLAVRAAAVCARAAQRDAGRPVPLRLAPDDRHADRPGCAAGVSTAATSGREWR